MGHLISVITPCYNEEETVAECVNRTAKVFKELLPGVEYEHIFADNASTDGTVAVLRELATQNKNIKVFVNSRNVGPFRNMYRGMAKATGDAVIPMLPADLQDPPEVIAEMIVHWKSGYDVVYGTRSKRQGETMFKRFTAKTFYSLFARLTRLPIPMQTGDFALMDAKVVRSLLQFREHGLYWRGLRCWNGFRQRHVSFSRPERIAGKSSYSFFKSLSLAKDAIFSFSEIPKRIPLYFFLLFLAGGIFALGLSFHLYGSRIALWPSLPLPFLILIIAMGLAQFLCVWLGSEYSARILDNVRDRPRWIIDKRTAHLEGKETNHA